MSTGPPARAADPVVPAVAKLSSSSPSPPPSSPVAKSFRDAVSCPPAAIPIKPIEKFKCLPCITFSPEEVQSLATRFQYALVGSFFGKRPPLAVIRTWLEKIGFVGFSVTLLHHHYVLFNFNSKKDFQRLFLRKDWNVQGSSMHITKWTPDFFPDKVIPIVPVWISVANLPIHFHDKRALLSIAQIFGKPLKVDATTESFSRPSIARFCVEMDLSQSFQNNFYIKNGDQPILLQAVFENLPNYCKHCRGDSCKFYTKPTMGEPNIPNNKKPNTLQTSDPTTKPGQTYKA
ncbi:hypothetical protein DM860_014045 [Cuscuta australis]|uniref:DUF4283 domain-containing protein n=1 Tax=Cuscuta australis TaxID=267555 RepID=A0A328DSN4_9ASTE|nr:hypothetical protein DM860_014045 [Cuscuta australis]